MHLCTHNAVSYTCPCMYTVRALQATRTLTQRYVSSRRRCLPVAAHTGNKQRNTDISKDVT